VRISRDYSAQQELNVMSGMFTPVLAPAEQLPASQMIFPPDKRSDQMKRLNMAQLKKITELLAVPSYQYSACLNSTSAKVGVVALVTTKLDGFKALSMPKLRAQAMNLGVDEEDLAVGVDFQFERTLSANSKLIRQSSRHELDNAAEREAVIDKIVRTLKAATAEFASSPAAQKALEQQYGPSMYPDDEPQTLEKEEATMLMDESELFRGSPDTEAKLRAAEQPAELAVAAAVAPKAAPGPFLLAQLAPDMVREVLTHLALTPQGGPQLTRLQATCRAMRDALAADDPEIQELWEIAARSRFVEEVDELMPGDIELLQDIDSVTLLRAEARTAQAFDNGASAMVRRELWSPTPLPRKPGRPVAGGVPPVLRAQDEGFAAYKRLHELRVAFKRRVTVVRGSISDLPFHVDAIVLPSDDRSMLDVGFGACGSIFKAANGSSRSAPGEKGDLDKYMEATYPEQTVDLNTPSVAVGLVLPSPSFAMSDRCSHLLHSVGPTWPSGDLDGIGRAVRWCRMNGTRDPDTEHGKTTWGWFSDVDGSLCMGTAEEAEISMDVEKWGARCHTAKYHATMVRRQVVRDLCVVYENIFDQAAAVGARSIALPGISTGSRGCPALTAAAVAMDIVQQRLAAGTCPEKVYFVAFDDSSNIFGAFSDVRQEILRRYELLIRPVDRPVEWRGGGWRGISARFDREQRAVEQSHLDYLATLEAQLVQEDQEALAVALSHGLEVRIANARAQVAQTEREHASAAADELAREAFDAKHGTMIAEGDIFDEIDEESTLMPLRRAIKIHDVDLSKEYAVAKKATWAYRTMASPYLEDE
jgi:hypothetical protein